MALEYVDHVIVGISAFGGGAVAGFTMWRPIKRRIKWLIETAVWCVMAVEYIAKALDITLPGAKPGTPPPFEIGPEEVTKPMGRPS